jgi:hypothetical protein
MAECSALTNSTLVNEVEAINAIYGSSTFSITYTNGGLRGLLRLPSFNFSFLLSFPTTYPAAPPVIDGIDNLLAGATPSGKAALSTFRGSLEHVWVPDSTCVYDLIERFNETFNHTNGLAVAAKPPQKSSTTLMAQVQIQIQQIDLGDHQQIMACTACLDQRLKIDMKRLRCGHFYCSDCLHSKSCTKCSLAKLST